jgi:hypothetical protein
MRKRIWELYKELRSLRSEVVGLKNALKSAQNEVQQRDEFIQFLEKEKLHSQMYPYDTKQIIIPNMYSLQTMVLEPRDVDSRPKAELLMRRLTDSAKIKLVDDLIHQGYIRKVSDNESAEIYEIKVVR